jgi:hypothetical protein
MSDLRTVEAWRQVHQPFELGWWKEHLPAGHCDDPGFTRQWDEIKAFIQPHGSVIDIGCGPRPPFAPCCTVIEPLALEYQKITPDEWWKGVTVYDQPAEQLVADLQGDTIVCWNALDHTIGWRTILDNMVSYGSATARFAIATDFWEPFEGHPGYPRGEFMAEIDKRFVIRQRREPFGRQLALLMTTK